MYRERGGWNRWTSQSLNDLSDNLRISMEELQRANEQLLDDIAKEREIEKKEENL